MKSTIISLAETIASIASAPTTANLIIASPDNILLKTQMDGSKQGITTLTVMRYRLANRNLLA